MGWNKILENGKPFPEVRCNGSFDDFSWGFCHQATHTCKLPHLVLAPSCTGIRHHKYGIQFLLGSLVFTLTFTLNGSTLHGLHHGIGNIIRCFCPDIHNLIIFFTLCYKSVRILSAYFFNLVFSTINNIPLGIRNNHCVNWYWKPSQRWILVTNIFEPVRKNNSRLGTHISVCIINEITESPFIHGFVHHIKRYLITPFYQFEKIIPVTRSKNSTNGTFV